MKTGSIPRLLDWLGDRLQDWGYALKLRDWWHS